jgi:SAM-dependent methyltransferase
MLPETLRRIYAFNQTERDRWVAKQAAAVPEGARVLDVGAGSCRYRGLFQHCHYQTQDFAQLPPAELGIGLTYGRIDYVSDILAIPVPDGSFDVVLCTEVLEHVSEPILAAREFARILRPGGRLLLTTPLGSGLHQEPYHFYGGYTPYWFDKHLQEAGFAKLTVQANGGFFKHYGQESQRFSVLLHPRRLAGVGGITRALLACLWVATLPWFYVIMPALCYFLDGLDEHRGFTVGYHVIAERR